MWIFTNGANIGVSKLIGDAVYNEKREYQSFHNYSGNLSNAPQLNFIGVIREDMLKYGDTLGSEKVNLKIYVLKPIL